MNSYIRSKIVFEFTVDCCVLQLVFKTVINYTKFEYLGTYVAIECVGCEKEFKDRRTQHEHIIQISTCSNNLSCYSNNFLVLSTNTYNFTCYSKTVAQQTHRLFKQLLTIYQSYKNIRYSKTAVFIF